MNTIQFFSDNHQSLNRAFLYGDAVQVSFFVKDNTLILAEECYFFLMASMRKMRMNIPLSYTLEYFETLFKNEVTKKGISDGIIHFYVYRTTDEKPLQKSDTAYYFEVSETKILDLKPAVEVDIIKEIFVNTNLLSNIRVHSPENIYAEIYAKENDLDDVILLNTQKRIARSIYGNFLFLEDNILKVPTHTEGAYISPLLESFVTFLDKSRLAILSETEIIAFESQKAHEILIISDEKGLFPVSKIRNKTFETNRFKEWTEQWKASF